MSQSDFDEFPLMSDRDLRMKMGIINAVLLPESLKADLGSLQTPINNWRIIFNTVFGAKLDILPDKAVIYRGEGSGDIFSISKMSLKFLDYQ
jgi:hypothetical protein